MRTLASSHASPARSTPSSARREGPARRLGAGRTELTPSRKVRGLVLLGVLFVTLVTAVLAPLTRMLWWVPLVGLTGVVAAFFWLRSAVQAEVRARRSARRPAPRHRTAASSRPARVTEGRDVADLAAGREAELVDGRTVTVVESSSAEGDGEGWSPVPVPPPTYTLKARAEYRPSGFEEPMGAEAQAANADTNADTDASADVAPGAGESADEGRAAYGT